MANEQKTYPPVPGKLDRGIAKAVERLQACGIETFESCEGGHGHAHTELTIRFHGTPEAGWRAAGVCLAYGLPTIANRYRLVQAARLFRPAPVHVICCPDREE